MMNLIYFFHLVSVERFLENTYVKWGIAIGIPIGLIAGILTIFPFARNQIVLIFHTVQLRISTSKHIKLQKQIIKYIKSDRGKIETKYIGEAPIKQDLYKSFSKLRKQKSTHQIEKSIYYIYLFSLLKNAKSRIWAASISDPLEWTDTPEEKQFLDLNIAASDNKIPVERIFIVKTDNILDFIQLPPIKRQIIQNEKSEFYYTYYVFEDIISQSLLRDIANGFLAFDDFAVAKDVFSDNEIRGIIETESLAFYNKIFTKLRQYAKPLNASYFEEITGKNIYE